MSNQEDSLEISVTIEEFLQNCLDDNFSERTVICYRSYLNVFKKFLYSRGINSINEITRETILEYRHYLQGEYLSPKGRPISVGCQGQKLSALKSYLNFCTRTCKLLLNPAEHLTLPKLPKTLPRGILSKQQMKKLLKLPDLNNLLGFRDRVIIEIFYSTGVRCNELVGINISDCHLTEGRIFIQNGKGNKQRWVPVGKIVCGIIREYLKTIRPALIKDKKHDALIIGKWGNRIGTGGVHWIISKYLKQLGIKSDCHGLRHTCATHLLRGKANIRVIQEILGHSSLNSTQIYTRVDIRDMSRAIEKAHPRSTMDCGDL